MNRTLFVIAILVASIAMSCGNCNVKDQNATEETTETVAVDTSNVVNLSFVDAEGNNIDVIFDNDKDVAIVNYLGEESVLASQKPASGFCYANENYEVQGKGNDIVITKAGQVIYAHEDEIVTWQAKNEKGDVLDMVFNNTVGEVKVYLNGGEQIDLKAKTAASGIWYANDNYELSGKGDHYQLKKGDEVVFEN